MLPNDHNSANISYLDTIGHIRERLQTLNAAMCAVTNNSTTAPSTPGQMNTDTDQPPPVNSPSSHDTSMYDPRMSRADKALLSRGQSTLENAFAFRASTHLFGQHWQTMTLQQQQTHLEEYIQSKYSDSERLDDITTFLFNEILHKPRGDKHVVWNGYFIEKVTALNVPYSSDTVVVEQDNETNPMPTTNKRSGGAPKPTPVRFLKSVPAMAATSTEGDGLFEHIGDLPTSSRSDGKTSSGCSVRGLQRAASTSAASTRTSRAAASRTNTHSSFGAMRNRLRRVREDFYVMSNPAFE